LERFALRLTAKDGGLRDEEIGAFLEEVLSLWKTGGDALLLPPDYTRLHSGAGRITRFLYDRLSPKTDVFVLPALGTHEEMSQAEREAFFGSEIPAKRFLVHSFRTGTKLLGTVPGEFVKRVSGGAFEQDIRVEVNRELFLPRYGIIYSIGQVVPHEVAGMANYTKNILVGAGGKDIIDGTHMLGAVYGMENIMGRGENPVRAVFDYAQEKFLSGLPIVYILTVTESSQSGVRLCGIFAGNERRVFEEACELSRKTNVTFVAKPFQNCVVYLDENEFKSTWLGNKAVYRTRLAMASGGELTILAPGVSKFGEDRENDRLIRKFGYRGRKEILALFEKERELRENPSVAAHLIHGSSNGRFQITYAPGHLSREEVEGANFSYLPLEEALSRYPLSRLQNGWNLIGGREIFFIENPALGLWALPD